MKIRPALLIIVGLALFGAAGYFVFDRFAELERQVAGLDRQLTETHQRLTESEARASAATRAANAAESRAAAAEASAHEASAFADEAESRAAAADARANAAEQTARTATTEREIAEQVRDNAVAERETAQQLAEQARRAEAEALDQARLARDEADEIRRRREMEINRLQESLNTIVETRRTAIGVVMNLGSDRVEFAFDKADLRPTERELLARIAGVLIASADQGFAIQVFGHTDDVGTAEYNLGLSERRARAVRDYLVDSGVAPDIVTIEGMGKSMPLVDGTDDQARARNRRVEIAVIDTLVDFRGARR